MPRKIAVGDVHGCSVELDSLLSKLKLQEDDHIIFAGDLVDKGPDSAGVVQRIRALSALCQVSTCRGNHEENHIRWMAKTPEKKMEMKRHAEFVEIHKRMKNEDCEYLRATVLYVSVPGAFVTHAGILELGFMPPALPFDQLSSREQRLSKTMCRVRYVDPKGSFVDLKHTDRTKHTFWAERYTGKHGVVYFGHQHWMQAEPKKFSHAFGIDLGCVFGGHLCAVEIDGSGRMAEVYTERAREQYAKPLELED